MDAHSHKNSTIDKHHDVKFDSDHSYANTNTDSDPYANEYLDPGPPDN